jgi:hypothetical protein
MIEVHRLIVVRQEHSAIGLIPYTHVLAAAYIAS